MYWNATLRVDPGLRGALWNASEIDEVYRCGLVALSLYGNRFEGKDIYALTRVLRNNQWLLGIDLFQILWQSLLCIKLLFIFLSNLCCRAESCQQSVIP